jgi:predicted O-methyltransferase YrrM
MVGDATRFLHKLAGPFDLIFQDGDRQLYGAMLDRLVDLLRPGGLLVMDHFSGSGDDETMVALRQRLAAEPRLHTSFLQVGDGVSVSVKRAS